MIRVLDLIDIGLLLFEKTGDLIVLLAEFGQKVLRLLDHTCKIRCILWTR